MSDAPAITRVRHELRRRTLRVSRVERLAPRMARVVFQGVALQGFTSLGFDDHVKLFFPATQRQDATADGAQTGAAPAMRDFTPRKYDAQAGELWIDFHLHAAGPAAQWAETAAVGQTLDIAGPKGSAIIAIEGIDTHVLIGDESALPAISRRLEELPTTSRARVLLELDEVAGTPALTSRASLEVHRVRRHSRSVAPAQSIIETLRTVSFPPDRCFVWVAMESRAARAVRRHLREERGIGKDWIKAAGYWQHGRAGAHEPVADEA